jgi:hypothetical protein
MSKGGSLASNDWFKLNGLSRDALETPLGGPSLTRQEFASECDINEIMAKYERAGQLPANSRDPMYVDFTLLPSNLMDTMRQLDDAQAAFMRLPAKVRREFDNNAHWFVEFASDPSNLGQMQEWGLAPVQDAPAVPAVASPASPAPAAPSAGPAGPATQSSP